MSDLWQRLKQRKLVQWAVAYVAFGFALLQGIDIVAQQFRWSEGVQRGITLALLLGFFVTLVLAWYHGEQGRQRVSGTELLLVALVLGFGGGFLWSIGRSREPPLSTDAQQSVPALSRSSDKSGDADPSSERVPRNSVAVLPFANDSGDQDQRFFSDGLSEDLITALAQFGGLKVISRDSAFQYRDSKAKPSRIGRELGVAHLLEGSVRRAGDKVRISATLVNAADGSVLWSQRYDRPFKDLFSLQDAITSAVAEALKARLLDTSGAAVQSDRPPSGSLDAYTAYLKGVAGQYRNSEQGLRDAIPAYEEALRLDPAYAAAQAGLAYAWADLGGGFLVGKELEAAIASARAAANIAVALDPDSAQAHLARGYVAQMDLDFAGFESETRRALQLTPGNPRALGQMGNVYNRRGQHGKGIQMFRRALQRDPRNVTWYINLSNTLAFVGEKDDAVQTARDMIALRPDATYVHAALALHEVLRGDYAAAMAAAKQEHDPFWRQFAQAMALQIGTDRKAADTALQSFVERLSDSAAYQIADIYAARGDPDKVFEWLQRAWRNRDPGLSYLANDPMLKPFRDDPRFAAFYRQVGLPEPVQEEGDASGTEGVK